MVQLHSSCTPANFVVRHQGTGMRMMGGSPAAPSDYCQRRRAQECPATRKEARMRETGAAWRRAQARLLPPGPQAAADASEGPGSKHSRVQQAARLAHYVMRRPQSRVIHARAYTGPSKMHACMRCMRACTCKGIH